MPNAPFRKYQTSGFAFEAYSSAIHSLERSAHNLTYTPLNLNLMEKDTLSDVLIKSYYLIVIFPFGAVYSSPIIPFKEFT